MKRRSQTMASEWQTAATTTTTTTTTTTKVKISVTLHKKLQVALTVKKSAKAVSHWNDS